MLFANSVKDFSELEYSRVCCFHQTNFYHVTLVRLLDQETTEVYAPYYDVFVEAALQGFCFVPARFGSGVGFVNPALLTGIEDNHSSILFRFSDSSSWVADDHFHDVEKRFQGFLKCLAGPNKNAL